MEETSARAPRTNEPMMAAADLAEMAVLMASQSANINVLEAIVLPVGSRILVEVRSPGSTRIRSDGIAWAGERLLR